MWRTTRSTTSAKRSRRGIPRQCPRDRSVLTQFFPERAKVARVVVELGALACGQPAGIAEHRKRRERDGRGFDRKRDQPGVRRGVRIDIKRDEDGLACDAGPWLERLFERRVAEH